MHVTGTEKDVDEVETKGVETEASWYVRYFAWHLVIVEMICELEIVHNCDKISDVVK